MQIFCLMCASPKGVSSRVSLRKSGSPKGRTRPRKLLALRNYLVTQIGVCAAVIWKGIGGIRRPPFPPGSFPPGSCPPREGINLCRCNQQMFTQVSARFVKGFSHYLYFPNSQPSALADSFCNLSSEQLSWIEVCVAYLVSASGCL